MRRRVLAFALTAGFGILPLAAQVCRLSVAGLNQSRRVSGDIHAECPEEIIHSAPFGNWGVTSNFGHKSDSHQFDGWCHNTRVCDNAGNCFLDCTDGWYEWNSCTDNALYRPPNCSLFNDANCSAQKTVTGINVHGTKSVDVPVRCPSSSTGAAVLDQGGCNDVKQYATGTNFMSLYELDPVCCDQLVQTVYFPEVTVPLSCNAFGCAPAAGSWVQPSSWDSPASPAKAFAEMTAIVNWGAFIDSNNVCRLQAGRLNVVSAASYQGPNIAPDSLASALGDQLAPVVAQATGQPLPASLGGASVTITDSSGASRPAALLYVSPPQINFLAPANLAAGPATLAVYIGDVQRLSTRIQVETVAPALFTANANGTGVAAAVFQHISAGGTSTFQNVFSCGATPGSCAVTPLDLGGSLDRNYLLLYGTGIRRRSALTAAGVVIGGENGVVEYAGPQNQYAGLDQVNVLIPGDLKGRGIVDVLLTVDGKPANAVQIALK